MGAGSIYPVTGALGIGPIRFGIVLVKLIVPLQTNPRATLTVDGADFHLEAGYAFEVNNLVPHSAFNGGEEDRIHFVFEVFEGAGHRGGPGSAASGALRPRAPPRLENALPRPSQLLRSALPGHLRPIPVRNMRRKMPHYDQKLPLHAISGLARFLRET